MNDAFRYQQLAQELGHEIETGAYPVGSLMPTEIELCDRFKVSRYTVREAMRLLRAQGLVTRRRGAGTVVLAAAPARSFNQPLGSVADILQYAHATKLNIRGVNNVSADARLAAQLGVAEGSRWVHVAATRVDNLSGRPVSLTEIYLAARFDGIAGRIVATTASYSEFVEATYGVPTARIEQQVAAVALDRNEALALDAERDEPALRTRRRYFDTAGDLIIVSDSLHPGDRFTLSMEFRRDGKNA